MKILSYRAYEGKNIYSHRKVVRMDVDLQGYCETPSKDIEGFNDKLIELLPEIWEHRCGIDEDHGFVKRLREGTYLAHVCEHTIIALHSRVGLEIAYGKAREIEGDFYYVVFEYIYKKTALAIARLAIDLINSLISKKNIDLDSRIKDIKQILEYENLGPSALALCDAAKKQGIPIIRFDDNSMFQFGYGRYSKMIQATIDSNTSSISVDIASDKVLTKKLLEMQFLPVAKGDRINSQLELLIEAEAIGYPVVLKPQYGYQGKGVYLNIKDEKQLIEAYNSVKSKYRDIMVEQFVVGYDYRVCVVDGEVVAVSKRIPPSVIGDGVSKVFELIDKMNQDENRGDGHEKPLTKVRIDSGLKFCVSKQGYSLNSVPEKGKEIILRENSNLSTGGTSVDCTDEICKENIDICVRAAKAIGLNICGIDLCCEDVSKPIYGNGIIVEVNAAPGIRMHHHPSEGTPRDVSGAIVSALFKNSPKSIPVIAITGTNGKTTTTRIIAHTLRGLGYTVGMTTTSGVFINDECIAEGDMTGFLSARSVLLNKDVDIAVLETARGGIIRNGLAYDLADVGVVTNITEDHLGIDEVNTLKELANVKSLIIEAVKPNGYSVINGDDPMCREISSRAKGNLVVFSKSKNNEFLRENLEKGNYGVYVDNNSVYVEKDKRIFHIADLKDIPITCGGFLTHNVENVLTATSALVGIEIDYCIISKGLKSFLCDDKHNKGRFNQFDVKGIKVILDYAHNIGGFNAIFDSIKKMGYKKVIGVIGIPGDRIDSVGVKIGELCSENLSYSYIKEDSDKRGRKPGEVAELIKSGFKNNKNYEIILDEGEALSIAIDKAKQGDVIVVFYEDYEKLHNVIVEKQSITISERGLA